MRVYVKLFAPVGRYSGNAVPGVPFEIDMPDGATLADRVNKLKLPREEVKVFLSRGRARPLDWPLQPGDEVSIFPLTAGG